MRKVLLDKNAGARKLRDWCNEQGVVACQLLPYSIRGGTDPEIAEYVILNRCLLLTFDKGFCSEAAKLLLGKNPGILLVRSDDGPGARQITTKTAPPALSRFKNEFPEWHLVSWKNYYVELTPSLIFVYQTTKFPPLRRAVLKRSEPGWQEQLKTILV